jgi:hypothetical protein
MKSANKEKPRDGFPGAFTVEERLLFATRRPAPTCLHQVPVGAKIVNELAQPLTERIEDGVEIGGHIRLSGYNWAGGYELVQDESGDQSAQG